MNESPCSCGIRQRYDWGVETTSPLLATAFFGPYVPQSGSPQRRRHIYAGLAHWYEAAKFMPLHPNHRDAVLFSPTVKEAQRYGRLRQEHWRSDWNLVRHSVLISGLGFMALQTPELELHTMELELIRPWLAPMNLPPRFIDSVLERFDAWRTGARIGFFGADTAPHSVIGQRADKLVTPLPSWTMVATCNNRAPWKLHDWALQRFIPIQYIGKPETRLNKTVVSQILGKCNQVVVFEERGARKQDSVIAAARAVGVKVALEIWSTPTHQGTQISAI